MATFSVTDRQTYRRCRRKWDYSSNARRNLTTRAAGPEPLELGSLVHRALADWIIDPPSVQQMEGRLPHLFLQHAQKRRDEIIEAFEARSRMKTPSDALDSLLNVVQLGAAMMNNYQLYHKTPIPPHMTFVSPEQEVIVPVPGTEHQCPSCQERSDNYFGNGQRVFLSYFIEGVEKEFVAFSDCKDCEGKGYLFHYLSATLDGLIQDEESRLLVLEHKTYDNRPQLVDLNMNDQFTGYAWVLLQLAAGQVGGVAYDGMWKRDKPPKYLQKEKRAGQIEDLFIRKILYKTRGELEAFGRNLTLEINEMASNPPIYPNVPWQGCSDCNFRDVCIMENRGEDPSGLIDLKYTQREVVRGGQVVKSNTAN